MDLRSLLDSWTLALRAERRADNTIKTYRAGVLAYLAWCADEDLPEALDRGQVRAWIAALADTGAEPTTTAARQSAVKRFSRWLLEEDEQDTDPLAGLKPPQLPEKLVNPLTDDELRALLKATNGKTFEDRRDHAIIRVLLETGLRPGELAALTVDDIDLKTGLVRVEKAKGGKSRTTFISPQACAAVDRYKRLRAQHKLAAGPNLWLGTRGRTFAYGALWLMVKTRAEQAGIGHLNPHRFRHTAATRRLRKGGREGGVQAAFGWSSRKMLDRYTAATASERAAEEARQLNLGDL